MNQSPVYILHKLVFALDRAADILLQDHLGISYNRALVLVVCLGQQNLTQHQIAVALGRTDAAVSALLRELIKDGYVTTRVDELHKRKNIVTLTQKGKDIAIDVSNFLEGRLESLAKAADVDMMVYSKQTEQLYDALSMKKEV